MRQRFLCWMIGHDWLLEFPRMNTLGEYEIEACQKCGKRRAS